MEFGFWQKFSLCFLEPHKYSEFILYTSLPREQNLGVFCVEFFQYAASLQTDHMNEALLPGSIAWIIIFKDFPPDGSFNIFPLCNFQISIPRTSTFHVVMFLLQYSFFNPQMLLTNLSQSLELSHFRIRNTQI